jgi:hypothetical protein
MIMAVKKNKSRWDKKGISPKLVELPDTTIKGLNELAEADRRKLKPYMEKVLIEHEINSKK